MKSLPANCSVADLDRKSHWRQFAPLRDRMRAVVLRRQGNTFREIAACLNRSLDFVKRWNDRFKSDGAPGLSDRIVIRSKSRLTDDQRAQFRQRILSGPTADDGFSAFRRTDMQVILRKEFGVSYSLSAISKLLKRLDITRLRPRPRHEKNKPEQMQTWRAETLPLFCKPPSPNTLTNASKSGSKTKVDLAKNPD